MTGLTDLLKSGAGIYFTHLEMREKWKHDRKSFETLARLKSQELKIQNLSQAIFEACRKNKLTYINSFISDLGKEGLDQIGCLPIAYCTNDVAEKVVWQQLNIYRAHAGLPLLPEPLN